MNGDAEVVLRISGVDSAAMIMGSVHRKMTPG
jgi:hypothetical protein